MTGYRTYPSDLRFPVQAPTLRRGAFAPSVLSDASNVERLSRPKDDWPQAL